MGDTEKEGAKKKKKKNPKKQGQMETNECVCVQMHARACVNGGSVFWVVTMIRRF